jgi:ABC-type lipoprotein export system ATPase subunit
VLITNNLHYQYSGNKSLSFPDLVIPDQGKTLILGKSGSGKTTLLHLLAGLRKPTSGYAQLDETIYTSLNNAALDAFRGEKMGLVFQTSHFVHSLSVLENIMLPLYFNRLTPDENQAKRILDKLEVFHKAFKFPFELSVGEQQRVAIARAIIHQPAVIFADEPTSALDNKNAEKVISLLIDAAEETQASLLVVTHDNRWQGFIHEQIEL